MSRVRREVFSYFSYFVIAVLAATSAASGQLSADYYDEVCPAALPAIRSVVEQAISREPRMGASLLRLHFHDCFVNGCDGSNLLDDTPTLLGEKTAAPNINSLRGFDVIDDIKAAVDSACYGSVVSCADILAVAARDSVSILGGPNYQVLLGRKDARAASFNDANNNIPSPISSLSQLLSNFQSHGLDIKDLVALSGAHTIGLARCFTFKSRIYNDTNIDPEFKASLIQGCPVAGGDNNTTPLDGTTTVFDTAYFQGLIYYKGLLHSDQELFRGDGTGTDEIVKGYIDNPRAFWPDFTASMIRMGNIKVLTGENGEVRMNCRKVN